MWHDNVKVRDTCVLKLNDTSSETPSRGIVTYHIEYIENVVRADDTSSSSSSCCYIVCCGRGKKKKRWRRCAAPPASRSPVTP